MSAAIVVEVRSGEVTLAGRLDRRSAVDLAGRLAARVSGVVQVTNMIGYEADDTAFDPAQVTPVA
ncbi:BON domain-containing protein [Micromonospora coriariae]|uniref:BON domain-containing protein n=1 Tax=Micromonospora coriariae TaxID=285665 RepID=UPI000B5AE305|nr:BON domain-containing protein [Micromonospora coriariae]